MNINSMNKTPIFLYIQYNKLNKGNAKRGVSPRLKIRACDLDL